MQNEKRAGHTILLHEILTLVNFAQFELFEQQLLDFLILNQRRKGKMVFETLEDESFVADAFFLWDLHEVFVDLVVVNTTHCTDLPLLALALDGETHTYSRVASLRVAYNFRSIRELISRLSFLSKDSISDLKL